MKDEHWLLSYEANVRGWLVNAANDHVIADANFAKLKVAMVHFYTPKFDLSRRLLMTLNPRRGQSYGDDESDNDDEDEDEDEDIDDDDLKIPDGVF